MKEKETMNTIETKAKSIVGSLVMICPVCGKEFVCNKAHHYGSRDDRVRQLVGTHHERGIAFGETASAHLGGCGNRISSAGQHLYATCCCRNHGNFDGIFPLFLRFRVKRQSDVGITLRGGIGDVLQCHHGGTRGDMGHLLP